MSTCLKKISPEHSLGKSLVFNEALYSGKTLIAMNKERHPVSVLILFHCRLFSYSAVNLINSYKNQLGSNTNFKFKKSVVGHTSGTMQSS